jgi:hypothetical protein
MKRLLCIIPIVFFGGMFLLLFRCLYIAIENGYIHNQDVGVMFVFLFTILILNIVFYVQEWR